MTIPCLILDKDTTMWLLTKLNKTKENNNNTQKAYTWECIRPTMSYQLAPILKHLNIPVETKVKLISSLFAPTLTYQCLASTLNKVLERKITTHVVRCLRRAWSRPGVTRPRTQRPWKLWMQHRSIIHRTAEDKMIWSPLTNADLPAIQRQTMEDLDQRRQGNPDDPWHHTNTAFPNSCKSRALSFHDALERTSGWIQVVTNKKNYFITTTGRYSRDAAKIIPYSLCCLYFPTFVLFIFSFSWHLKCCGTACKKRKASLQWFPLHDRLLQNCLLSRALMTLKCNQVKYMKSSCSLIVTTNIRNVNQISL